MKTDITLWGDDKTAKSRPVRAYRACECGCDNRGRETPLVGYVSGPRY